MRDRLSRVLATFFFMGNFPVAPGSLASLAGTLLAISLHGHPGIHVFLFLLITFAGFAVSGRVEKLLGQKDPSCIVIDEVSGVLLAFFTLPLTPAVIVTTFFLFRAFDMFKIYPVNRFEELPGAVGIMADDLWAGFYTNITMQLALRWAGII
ncbi:MAG: phosphatidylglycerophosphatase A [Candidatus Omnitrophica bacterium]|nr:phosphatidylglycerophosphatase A [Candidatus Omnitrophota bacterium]